MTIGYNLTNKSQILTFETIFLKKTNFQTNKSKIFAMKSRYKKDAKKVTNVG
jgi:hypothetical protein